MKKPDKLFYIFFLWFLCINGTALASGEGGLLSNFKLAVLAPGQSKTFTSESEGMFGFMIIEVIVLQPGTLSISVSKTDSTGDIIGVIQKGDGHPDMEYNVGITPRTLTLSSRFWWDYGRVVVISFLFSIEDTLHKYSVRLSY